MNIRHWSAIALSLLLLGCGNDDSVGVDQEIKTLIETNGLTGDPSTGRTIPQITSAKAQLGMKLFFSKALGGDSDAACVTCHHPVLGGGDNLSLSIGVGAVNMNLLGTGRVHSAASAHYDGFAPVPRNAPSTFNLVLWDKVLFWDGRLESITPTAGKNGSVGGIRTPDSAFGVSDPNAGANLAVAQARFPVTSPEEMRGFVFEAGNSNAAVRAHLGDRLSNPAATDYITNTWQNEFEAIYGSNSVNFSNIVDAIGEYERSQLFINTPWKAYVQGDRNALSAEAKRGAKLFFNSTEKGGMNCVACHSGDFFTDENFWVMAVPQVGRGKNTLTGEDLGRISAGADATKRYAFRTPTLLNVEMTGPWGHDGAYTSLKAMVAHMVNPETAVAGYDYSQLDSNVKTVNSTLNTADALSQLLVNKSSGISPHKSVTVTDGNIDDLVAFLKSLTDPCIKDRNCLDPWIPQNSAGVDGLQLNAEDISANRL